MTDTPENQPKNPKPRSLAAAAIFVSFLAGGLGGAASTWALGHYRPDREAHARIAILDVSSLARGMPEQGDVSAIVSARVAKMRKAAEKLRDAGWIVLDSQAVVGAPEDLYVPLDAGR